MVVISSQLPTSIINQSTGFLHELKNSTIMAKSVAKESRTVPSVDFIEDYIRDAYRLSVTGRPGPVHVEIPLDILASEQEYEVKTLMLKEISESLIESSIKQAAKLINASENVAVIAGGGACSAAEQVEQLVDKLSAPIVQTAAGKGIVSDRHPLCIGTRLPFRSVRDYLNQQDVVIAIGTQLAPTDLWETNLELKGKLIRIDIDSDAFYRNYRADIGLKGDSKAVLKAILPQLKKKEERQTGIINKIIRDTVSMGPAVTGNTDTFDIGIQVLECVRSLFDDDDVFVTDMTTAAYIGLSEYPTYKPRTFLHPVGFGTLGYAVPAAIGAKTCQFDKNVVALIGDGGFQFTMQELAVACELNMPLPIIIWNNDGYGEIKRNEAAMGFSDFIAVTHKNPDFIKLAEAYGIDGVTTVNSLELKNAVQAALKKTEPTIIEVNTKKWGEQ